MESASERAVIRVLDVGCGRGINPPGDASPCWIVGVDISEAALALNEYVDEKIVADIETYQPEEGSFDLVFCSDVLEHLARPELAFAHMAAALKPGGRLQIGVPNLLTPKGLITKFTPHSVHVLVYRHLFGKAWAGQPGFGPYPTFLRWTIRPAGLVRLAEANGLVVIDVSCQSSEWFAQFWARHRVLHLLLTVPWRIVTLGRLDPHAIMCKAAFAKPVG